MVWVWSFLGFLWRWWPTWRAPVRQDASQGCGHSPNAMLHGFHGRRSGENQQPGALFRIVGVPQTAETGQLFGQLDVVLEDVSGHGAAAAKADTLRLAPLSSKNWR